MILALCNTNKAHIKWIKNWLTDLKKQASAGNWDWMNVPNVPLGSVQGLIFFSNFTNSHINISLNTVCEWHEFGRMLYSDEDWAVKQKLGIIQRIVPCSNYEKKLKSSICWFYQGEDGKRRVLYTRDWQRKIASKKELFHLAGESQSGSLRQIS